MLSCPPVTSPILEHHGREILISITRHHSDLDVCSAQVEVIDLELSNDKDDSDIEVVGPPSHSTHQGTESPGFSNFSGSDDEEE